MVVFGGMASGIGNMAVFGSSTGSTVSILAVCAVVWSVFGSMASGIVAWQYGQYLVLFGCIW